MIDIWKVIRAAKSVDILKRADSWKGRYSRFLIAFPMFSGTSLNKRKADMKQAATRSTK